MSLKITKTPQAKKMDAATTVHLMKIQIDPEVIALIPERIARAHGIVAYHKEGKTLDVAAVDASQSDFLEMLSHKTELTLQVHTTSQKDIDHALTYYKRDLQGTIDRLLRESGELAGLPVTKIVDTLIQSAYDAKASDIHLEPQEGNAL